MKKFKIGDVVRLKKKHDRIYKMYFEDIGCSLDQEYEIESIKSDGDDCPDFLSFKGINNNEHLNEMFFKLVKLARINKIEKLFE